MCAGALVAGALVAGGCKRAAHKHSAPAAATPVDSVPVVGFAELPTGTDLGSAAAFVNVFRPGAGAAASAMLGAKLAAWVGANDLGGADLSKPIRIIVADPNKFDRPVAALLFVRDAKALRQSVTDGKVIVRGKRALVGAAKVVNAIAGYAFSTLATAPLPKQPRVTILARRLFGSYKAKIARARSQLEAKLGSSSGKNALGGILDVYFNMLSGMGEQTQRVELTLGTEQGNAVVRVTAVAQPKSAMAEFFSAQSPSDFHLLSKLPAGESFGMIFAGHVVLGPARKPSVAFMSKLLKLTLGANTPKDVTGLFNSLFDLFTGDVAAAYDSFHIGAMPKFAEVLATTDAAKAKKMSDRIAAVMGKLSGGSTTSIAGLREHFRYRPDAETYHGVAVGEEKVTYDLSGVAPAARQAMATYASQPFRLQLAGAGKMFVVSSGDIHALIDAARGAGPGYKPPAAISAQVAAARTRKDSFIAVMNLPAMIGGAAAALRIPKLWIVGAGFRGGAMHLRVIAVSAR